MIPKVAVMFHQLGPYHWSRLSTAASQMHIICVELSAESSEYAWDKLDGEAPFERITLFPENDSRSAPRAELISRLCSTLDQRRPQVVVIPGWSDAASLAALQWCAAASVPAVVMSDSADWDERRVGWKEFVKRRIIGLFSSALVGGTPHADYVNQLGMARDRVFRGYDAVDNRYFEDKAAESRKHKVESRNRYGLPEKYFLASARFIEKKNLPRLLQAYASYRKKAESRKQRAESAEGNAEMLKTEMLKGDTDKAESRKQKAESTGAKAERLKTEMLKAAGPWDLVLLGSGALRESLCALRSALGLDAVVHLPGFKQYPDLPTYYGLASAFIHASTTEQWGLVVNEAMASGLPVLVSNRCGCAPDLVHEGVNGFTFDPCNVEQLARLMVRLAAAAKPRLDEMGANSAKIIQNWGPDRFATGLKEAAEKAIEVGPKKASLVSDALLWALSRIRCA